MKLEVGGVRLHVVRRGPADGPPVVLVHGFPFDHRMWAPQLEALSDTYRLVAYDIRGLGRSEPGDGQYTMETFVDDLLAVMDGLETGPVVGCGLSLGGYILLRAMEREPDRFRALALCDTRSEADSDEAKVKRAAAIRRVKAEGLIPLATEFPGLVLGPTTLERSPEVASAIRAMIEGCPPLGVCGAQLAMAARTDTTLSLERIRVPTLLLFGEEDPITPPEVGREMARRIPNAVLKTLAGAGHVGSLERPEAFTAVLRRFLDDVTR